MFTRIAPRGVVTGHDFTSRKDAECNQSTMKRCTSYTFRSLLDTEPSGNMIAAGLSSLRIS